MTDTLPLFATAKAPRVTEAEIASLRAALFNQGWQSWKRLRARWLAGELPHFVRLTDRKVRAMAAASGGVIISGQFGYALQSQVTVKEAQHAIDWLKHQANEMLKRAREQERNLHQRTVAA